MDQERADRSRRVETERFGGGQHTALQRRVISTGWASAPRVGAEQLEDDEEEEESGGAHQQHEHDGERPLERTKSKHDRLVCLHGVCL